MLCKLLGCTQEATERRITPLGAANICDTHASDYDARGDTARGRRTHVLDELRFAFRYGPVEDPPLEQANRGEEYAHPRRGVE